MNIQNIVEKYGVEITKTLGIASTKLYEKMLWYVRINGIVDILAIVLSVFGYIVFTVLGIKIMKKNWKLFADDFSEVGPQIILPIFIAVMFYMIFPFIVVSVIESLSKIVAPEYWIISQIINKVK